MFSQTLRLRSHIQTPGSFRTDIWGFIDSSDGKSYAVAGDQSGSGIAIIDVSNPDHASIVSTLPGINGFDVKVWKNYIYTVSGGYIGNGDIVDVSDPHHPQRVGGFPNSHNIFISAEGLLIDDRLNIYDLTTSPTSPQLLYTGGSQGHDVVIIGNRLYDFHGYEGTRIFEFDDQLILRQIGAIVDPAIVYHHSGWATADHRYLFICDELAKHPTADITIWDISSLDNPVRVGEYGDSEAIVHNLYIVGNYAIASYYTAGLRIFDISDPQHISLAAEYDTSPFAGEQFAGAFGVFPFFNNGIIAVNDWQQGVFIFSFSPESVLPEDLTRPVLLPNFPNPFNGSTLIRYFLPEDGLVKLSIYNILGEIVRSFAQKRVAGGVVGQIQWDGKDNFGRSVSTGNYIVRLESERGNVSRVIHLTRR
jgi:choice-of-anchor B domain-containing protein